jgi:hypothetical protein
MGLNLGFYSFQDCFPVKDQYCYILDANYSIDSGVSIKRALFYLERDDELEKEVIHIEFDGDNYSGTFGYMDNPKWNLLSNMYWISEKDFHDSFHQ